MVIVREVLQQFAARFQRAGVESARLNAELLLSRVLGVTRGELMALGDNELTAAEHAQFAEFARRRLSREPVDYILGEREFYGRSFHVRPGVLIPRPETELIIDTVKREVPEVSGWAADIGCGSGVLGVTLALELPALRVLATDLSPHGVAVTTLNAQRLNAANRVHVARMDGLSAARGGFALIVSNPPYIDPAEAGSLEPEVGDHEPAVALFGGADGTETSIRFLHQVADRLLPGGLCLFEHGFTQGERLRKAATAAGLRDARTIKDMAGLDRMLVARK
jgi:release factor glutamine methyltransferase